MSIKKLLARHLASLPDPRPDTNPDDVPLACGALPWPVGDAKEGQVYCDGLWHQRVHEWGGWETLHRCSTIRSAEIRSRIQSERKRLSGELGLLERHGGARFDGYDSERHHGAANALRAMLELSNARPPRRNVMLIGPAGLGKTRLLLASHFTLLAAGISSQYVTTPELRKLFRLADSFDEEVAREARGKLDRYVYAQVVHLDDVGHIENDKRARGQFAEGLKDLLDRSRATAWAVATNRTSAEAEQHPDLSGTIISRFQLDADVVIMDGPDFRVETAR